MRGCVIVSVFAFGCSSRAEPLDELPAPAPTSEDAGPTAASPHAARPTAPTTHLDGPHLRVLGTAQDGGLPHAACTCPRCETARRDPARARGVASIALVDPPRGRAFLIDATPDIHVQLHALRDVGERPQGSTDRAPIAGVLLTHAHVGHYLGLALFGFEAVHTRALPVWASPRMSAFLRGNAPWDQLVRLENIELREAAPAQPIELTPDLRVIPFAVPHRDEYTDTYGFVIQGPHATAVYVPDTAPWKAWSRSLPDLLEAHAVDVALLDATFYSGHELPGRDLDTLAHPLVVDTMDLLQPLVDAGRVKVYFTHLNHSNPALDPDGPERAAIVRRGFFVAEDGLEIAL